MAALEGQEHKPGSVLPSLAKKITRAMPAAAGALPGGVTLLLPPLSSARSGRGVDEEVLFCSERDICQARGLWGAGTATEAVLEVSLQKDCSHGSIPASPAQPCQASGLCLWPGLWAEQKFSWFC